MNSYEFTNILTLPAFLEYKNQKHLKYCRFFFFSISRLSSWVQTKKEIFERIGQDLDERFMGTIMDQGEEEEMTTGRIVDSEDKIMRTVMDHERKMTGIIMDQEMKKHQLNVLGQHNNSWHVSAT
jgi:hypothetical protein